MVDRRLILEIFHDFCEFFAVFVTKLRGSIGNRSQMFSGGGVDVCAALSRVCALSGGETPSEFTKKQAPRSRFLTVPELGVG